VTEVVGLCAFSLRHFSRETPMQTFLRLWKTFRDQDLEGGYRIRSSGKATHSEDRLDEELLVKSKATLA
jgi:hypothetical protein